MSFNSSSSSNASLLPAPLYSIPVAFFLNHCLTTTVGIYISVAFTIISIFFLLPLFILVLYLGLQQWRQQRSSTTMSHSDLFTYHMVIIELLSVLGSLLICCGIYIDLPQMTKVGIYIFSINFAGQMFFHLLTCLERYLAVVHPITYLSLRKAKGVRVRNITICCVWLLCFAWTGLMAVEDQISNGIISFFIITLTIVIISVFNLSVLCVLLRPGPGEGCEGRQQIDQSKLRAFYTIMAILGVLLLKFGWVILSTALYISPQLGQSEMCVMLSSTVWIGVPSSLVLPLLFLQRAGTLLCCKNNK